MGIGEVTSNEYREERKTAVFTTAFLGSLKPIKSLY